MINSVLIIGFSLCVSIWLIGCISVQTIQSAESIDANTQVIRVHLTDQRVISFWPEKYIVDRESDSAYIRGVGLVMNPQTRTETKYEGSIAYKEIDHIDVEEETTFTKVARPTALAFVGIIALLVIMFSIFPPNLGG